MKKLLVLLFLLSSTAFGMVDSKKFHWQYTFEGKTFYFVSEDNDWLNALEAGAKECMKFFKADADKDEERFEILTGECVNPK